MERTFAIIKPDATSKRYTGKILQRIEEAGFTIRAMKTLHLPQKEAEGFLRRHRERPFFKGLTEFMASGPIVAMVLEAPDAIKKWRTLMGATDPRKPTRARFARSSRARSAKTPRMARMRRRRRPSKSAISSLGWNSLSRF